MKIKNYVCKCGCDDFSLSRKSIHVGIYCMKCGRWLKWANHDERNLIQLDKGDNHD